MTQQVFAENIGLGAATLSGIFNDRTRPTLNVVEALKKKYPTLNIEWLMFGTGPMFNDDHQGNHADGDPAVDSQQSTAMPVERTLDFQAAGSGVSQGELNFAGFQDESGQAVRPQGQVRPTLRGSSPAVSRQGENYASRQGEFASPDFLKNIDKIQRHVTEIRVYYDDQTWESFVPSKK